MLESILFHGSDHVVDHPFRGGGKSHNDYGSGFYCTPDMELAREWACSSGSTSAFVNHYSLEPNTSLTVANLSAPPYHVLNWLAVLLKNRHFDIPEMVEPELMYKLFAGVAGSLEELVGKI